MRVCVHVNMHAIIIDVSARARECARNHKFGAHVCVIVSVSDMCVRVCICVHAYVCQSSE